MDEIAQAVGINRALIYRVFESKEEVFVLTVTRYLDEITERGVAALNLRARPERQLRVCWGSFASYCLEHPAFLDCALSLMRRPGGELRERVSDATWFRLGQSMSRCLGVTIDVVNRGVGTGAFMVEDPAFTVNCLYTQTIGMMHLARVGLGVHQVAPGIPGTFEIAPQSIHEACVRAALAAVGAG